MLHIDHIDLTDPFGKFEDFMFRERLRGEPAFILLPDHRRVQALFDRCPDREIGSEFITIDDDVRSIADADLIDLIEESSWA